MGLATSESMEDAQRRIADLESELALTNGRLGTALVRINNLEQRGISDYEIKRLALFLSEYERSKQDGLR